MKNKVKPDSMKFNIETTPSLEQLQKIKLWLTQESQEFGEGFLCNWNIIQKYFDDNQLVILLENYQPIGFTTWSIYDDFLLKIDIVEIHPQYRSNGAGKFMMSETFKFLENGEVKVVELFCEPRSSESFWRKLGFMDLKSDYDKHDLTLFMPLIDTLETKNDHNGKHLIELWDCEPYRATNSSPKWTWSINLKDCNLHPPILVSGGGDWNIRWSENGEVLKESKVKNFSRECPIYNNGYIYITKLKYP